MGQRLLGLAPCPRGQKGAQGPKVQLLVSSEISR